MSQSDGMVDSPITERFWCPAVHAWVRLVERRTLFGRDVARVVVEGGQSVHTVPFDLLRPDHPFDLATALATVAGARVWSALGSDLFLSPLVSKVIPLPHQFRVLRRAMSSFPVRVLCADEVGMGKTIEAGLLLKELKLKGVVERILILAPKSLLLQWIVEMESLFEERFDLVLPASWSADVGLREENAWKRYTQVITSVDSVKPKESQRGWTADKVARYNVERFHDLVGAGWDLAIVDEAHLVAGASDEVSRFELAKGLAQAVPHLILLTATPHSGKSDAFRRLLSLVDPAIADAGALTRERVRSVVIRSEKRTATDADGKPLFAPRTTTLLPVPFTARHAAQRHLYEEVSQYVIAGYNKALRTGDRGSRLLLILIQRLVSSSTRAIRRFLERRAEVLGSGQATERVLTDALPSDEDLNDLAEGVLFSVPANTTEREDVERLLAHTRRVEASGPDARAEALYDTMMRLAQQDAEPSKKFLVFTEFTATQEMLKEYLEQRGYPVAILNGGMSITERRQALEEFRTDAQVLVSTDAGGVGLNMQFAHVVLNYDLPFAVMRVEQRIGRVDRIGQTRPVTAVNLVTENSVEQRLYEIWQVKLATILAEFGVDKTADVLDSSAVDAEFEKLARTALFQPEAFDHELDRVVVEVRKAAQQAHDTEQLYTGQVEQADQPPAAPLHEWLATMRGAERSVDRDGAVAVSEQMIQQINDLTPFFAPGVPAPHLDISGLGFPLDGWIGIWKVGIADGHWRQQHVFPLYTTDDGDSYPKSAQRLWDELAARRVSVTVREETGSYDLPALTQIAEGEAEELFLAVVEQTRERARRRMSALELSYLARRSALARIEQESTREARRLELQREYQQRRAETTLTAEALPDLVCLFLARVTAA